MPRRILIQGAAGRDFHNFNTMYRGKRGYEVVCFTAAQIPDIDDRKYPAKLAGKGYPKGIPIYSEDELEELIVKYEIDEVVFSYSDVPHEFVMHQASRAIAAGADFTLLGPAQTMIRSKKPLVAVCAVRTGAGKSQTTRRVCELLKERGLKVVAIRHPMPYGDLRKQICQRFAELSDLDKHECTIEEREEYEPHIVTGTIIYAGVDYGVILKEAEKEADVIVWDGGNNDLPFYRPDLYITVADPHRPGDELTYHPGEVNLMMADVVVINKIATATSEGIETVRANTVLRNPDAIIIDAASPISVEDPNVIRGKRVLVVEDGPTLTHGGMKYGAGIVAARKFGAKEIVDPRPWLKGTLKETFAKYPEIGALLPAMGYGDKQVADLRATINAADVDAVVIGTPIDLRRIFKINKPSVRVRYDLQEIGRPDLGEVIDEFWARWKRDTGKKKRQ
ncbi:MAG TPA: cyclic 2,3-diphosphoglycerate synthase [Acidobacteriota bacterium]|nr:cyclic 2,3-diphosphoglycerate synthase [Acidobacteriota bacterium]